MKINPFLSDGGSEKNRRAKRFEQKTMVRRQEDAYVIFSCEQSISDHVHKQAHFQLYTFFCIALPFCKTVKCCGKRVVNHAQNIDLND